MLCNHLAVGSGGAVGADDDRRAELDPGGGRAEESHDGVRVDDMTHRIRDAIFVVPLALRKADMVVDPDGVESGFIGDARAGHQIFARRVRPPVSIVHSNFHDRSFPM